MGLVSGQKENRSTQPERGESACRRSARHRLPGKRADMVDRGHNLELGSSEARVRRACPASSSSIARLARRGLRLPATKSLFIM
jgi:hypothetical protein